MDLGKNSLDSDNRKGGNVSVMDENASRNKENLLELERINASKEMNEVQWHMLDMLKVLVRLFEEYNIKYYMIGGTILGAVRHKGFIPWDDDIDLAIPRNDYDRFLSIAKGILPESMILRTYNDDSYHHYYFARVVDSRYKILRKGSLKEREEELWIDIFPLDGLPRNKARCLLHKAKLLSLKVRYHFASFDKVNLKRPNRPLYQKMIINAYLRWPFKTKEDYKPILDRIDHLLKKVPLEESDYYMEFMGSSIPFRETCTKEQYGEGKLYDFEDIKLVGPSDAEFYLSHVYGDYMMLPPKEKRNYHAAQFIKNS